MAARISNGPLVDALASISKGADARVPSGRRFARNTILTLSVGAIEPGSTEHVFRCSRNFAMSLVATLATLIAGASKSSPGRAGRPRFTWYLTLRSGSGGRHDALAGGGRGAGCAPAARRGWTPRLRAG